MTRTFSNKIRVRSQGSNVARSQSRPRIGQGRINPRPMPTTILVRKWLDDGTQVAIAQTNDTFVAARFDANERPLSHRTFTGGQARDNAQAWVKAQVRKVRGF